MQTFKLTPKPQSHYRLEAAAQQKLTDLNNNIQAAKEALGITGILKTLKF